MRTKTSNYFQERTDERLSRIEEKIDALLEFKSRLLGSSAAIATIVSVVIGAASVYFGTH
jgi:hypothetical protein